MKRIFFPVAAALIAATLLVSCGPKTSTSETHSLPGGLRVESLDTVGATGAKLTADEIVQLLELNAQIWRFDIVIPEGTEAVEYGLVLREKGKSVRMLGPMTQAAKGGQRQTLLAGLLSQEGSITEAKRLKVFLQVSSAGRGDSSRTLVHHSRDNPFQKSTFLRTSRATLQEDGGFLLATGGKHGNVVAFDTRESDFALMCTIRTVKIPK